MTHMDIFHLVWAVICFWFGVYIGRRNALEEMRK